MAGLSGELEDSVRRRGVSTAYPRVVGDSQILIADLTVADTTAAATLAASVREWLCEEGVIDVDEAQSDKWSNTTLPGPRWTATTDGQYEPDGVALSVGPEVHVPMANVGQAAICPRCGSYVATKEWVDASSEMLTAWVHGSGIDNRPCPSCGAELRVSDWNWDDGEPWALSYLAIEFWNWPPLNVRFIADLRAALGDHEIAVIRVHI